MLGVLLGNADDIQSMTIRDIEAVFKDSGCSDSQSKSLIAKLKGQESQIPELSPEECQQILAALGS